MAMCKVSDEHRDLSVVESDQKISDIRVLRGDLQLATVVFERNTCGRKPACQWSREW